MMLSVLTGLLLFFPSPFSGHLVPGIFQSTDLSEGLVLPTYEENENLTISLTPVPFVRSTGRGANITEADIEASNGVIHEIDRTMLPTCMTKSIGQIGREDGRFTTLFELAALAPNVNFSTPIGLTVFAPTDEAFAALGEETLAFLKDPANLSALEAVLLHHAFLGNIYSAGLLNVVPTRSRSAAGTSSYWYLEGETLEIRDASVTEADILGRNGVFHVIDEVMLLPSIVDLLGDIPEYQQPFNFTSLLGALELAGLSDVLEIDDLNGPTLYTLLAPTNEAFANAPALLDKFVQEGWIETHLTAVLLNHVAAGAVNSSTVVTLPSIGTVSGEELTVSVNGTSVKINDADVVTVDHYPYNGIIHGIDEVLVPPSMTKSIPENLLADDRFTELVNAVNVTGLLPGLEAEGPLTVFAPTNDAFAAIDTSGLTFSEITAILTYHVAAENVALEDGVVITTLNGADVLLTLADTVWKVNDANIEETILSSNGIIYAIDAVLIPGDTTPTVDPPIDPTPTPAPVESTPSPVQTTPSPVESTPTIVEILMGDDRFTTLVTLVSGAGLAPPLEGEGPLTVFAPTNQAFIDLGLPEDTDQEVITSVLLYHVVGGEVPLEDGLSVKTLNGAEVILTVTETETKVNDANIEETIPASNGIVYVIDTVLIPPSDPTPAPVDPTPAPVPNVTPVVEMITPVDFPGCMEVDGDISNDDSLLLGTCSDTSSKQEFTYDGTYLHPGGDSKKCLQAGRMNAPSDGKYLRVFECDSDHPLQKFSWNVNNGGPLTLTEYPEFCVVFRGNVANVDADPIIIKKCQDIPFMRRGWKVKM
jgi:transforming growth factor-beta-induced protein